ncbi:MAG: transposase, partial [Longispora sp.]|nr:transposase [Longispora sp. (in: high G+C Gram-positive bacteria)]
MSSVPDDHYQQVLGALIGFRSGLYDCFTKRADASFELVDAVLCASGPVTSLVELSEQKVFRRGHGALYEALACGDIDVDRLAGLLAASWEPADAGPIKLAVDTSAWPRPDAVTSAGRCHCYRSCRCDGVRQTIPGWPFSFVAGLEWGADSHTAMLDVRRVGPGDDATVVTVEQVAGVIGRLGGAETLRDRPASIVTFDAGYDLTRIAYLAAQQDLGVQVLGRVRSDRVYYYAPTYQGRRDGRPGRPAKHGHRFELSKPASLPDADEYLTAQSGRYGGVSVSAWHGLHQKLSRTGGWADFEVDLPIVSGTLIRIQVERLPGDRKPQDVWLWHHAPEGTVFDLDVLWKTYLRRFDLEHTFRMFKQDLGWTAPQIQTPEQGQRWSWLIVAAHTQLRLARALTADMRRRWEKPIPAGRLMTPGRVRRGFATLRRILGTPAAKPKPSRPGPGRPKGTLRPPGTRQSRLCG